MSSDESTRPKGPIAWMARNPVAANLFMFVVFAGGLMGLLTSKQEVFPEFDLDLVTVAVPYPGASPAEVEQGIVLAVEEAVRGIDGVKRVNSSANEGAALVSVEALLGADVDKLLADVKSAVDRITTLPADAEEPIVSIPSRRKEVISLVIAGERDLQVLHDVAERAREELLANPDVSQVEVTGVRPLEIAIELDRETLESYGLSVEEVARQVQLASVELPGGGIDTRGGELLVRVADRRREGWEFAEIPLRGTNKGYALKLGDVATIRDGYAETDQAAYFEGQPAVRLTVFRIGDEKPTVVAKAVREYAETLRGSLPADLTVSVWADDSELLADRIDLLVRNARTGLLLVLIILALFLELRLALWVALGIPVSVFAAFLVMPSMDLSVNMVSLFAFIVTLGLVVDDAIVVGENVHARIQAGESRLKAAINGTREMAVPVTFSILTTVAAFTPLLFVPGVMGKIFQNIPVVVIAVLVGSLFESFFILPAHLGHGGEGNAVDRFFHRLTTRVGQGLEWFSERVYRPSLRVALGLRYVTVAAAFAFFAVAVGLVASGRVPFSFFPKVEGDLVVASARLPYGAPLESTEAVRRELEQAATRALEELGGEAKLSRGMFARVGEGPLSREGRAVGSHLVSVEISLVPSDDREVSSAQVTAAWTKQMPALPGVEALTFNSSTGPGAGRPVDVQLSHTDIGQLERASEKLTEVLRGYPQLTDIENAFSAGKPQLDFHLLPEARTLGLSASDLARQIRGAFFGAEALREQRGRNELRVMVRLPEHQRRSENDLERLQVRTAQGGFVPLSAVAAFDRGRAPTAIRREEGARIVNVGAELAPGVRAPKEVLDALTATDLPALKAAFPGLKASFAGQQREQKESFDSLKRMFLFALFVIYALLAIPFKSYLQPLVIMSAIPLGFVGAIGGHLLMGYELSLISMMGIIALSGVVVNDSLVLVDAANAARREGMSVVDALFFAGQRRLRPILLTSLTTFFGLAPMILETSVQARFLIPMAVSLGFGVIFATFICLLVVPALYLMLEDVKGLFAGKTEEPAPETEPAVSLDRA